MAGGAETLLHCIMMRLAGKGHAVTGFTGRFAGCPRREVVDSVEYIRYAGRFMMYPLSYICYRDHVSGRYDVIIESINGVPFFTPLFAKEPVVPLIHQLTRENWYSGLAFPLAFVGYHAEDSMLAPYRRLPSLGVSDSTKSDLERIGFTNVSLLLECVDIKAPEGAAKETVPTLIYVGRLVRSKRVDHAIRAMKLVHDSLPRARLWIVGSGPEKERLAHLAQELGLSDSVRFFGHVDERQKADLFSRAHIFIFPGTREGWGLTVIEANRCGTPVIGYDIPGLRDSITEGVNGRLVPSGSYEAMASGSLELLRDRKALQALSISARKHSMGFTPEKSADSLIAFLEGVVG
jgi:glycosyltransferase involved in cell wall biosynthesis